MTVFFFGTNFTAVKIVVESVPPILFAATRFTLAGCLLLLIVPFLEPESRLRRGDFLPVLGLGAVGVTLPQTVSARGERQAKAANTARVYSTAPGQDDDKRQTRYRAVECEQKGQNVEE